MQEACAFLGRGRHREGSCTVLVAGAWQLPAPWAHLQPSTPHHSRCYCALHPRCTAALAVAPVRRAPHHPHACLLCFLLLQALEAGRAPVLVVSPELEISMVDRFQLGTSTVV